MVERAGATLRSKFPVTTLWDGVQCGRQECITCTQGAEKIYDCTRSSLLYENICSLCNQGAGKKEELKEPRSDIPTLYVGETCRSIQERGAKHWEGWRRKDEKNHIHKHQILEHEGAPPKFILRPVSYHKTALNRQIAEAVRWSHPK